MRSFHPQQFRAPVEKPKPTEGPTLTEPWERRVYNLLIRRRGRGYAESALYRLRRAAEGQPRIRARWSGDSVPMPANVFQALKLDLGQDITLDTSVDR